MSGSITITSSEPKVMTALLDFVADVPCDDPTKTLVTINNDGSDTSSPSTPVLLGAHARIVVKLDHVREQLAKMPHTPDGTLVVLGETVVWRRRYDDTLLHGVVVGVDVADKTVHAKWYSGDKFVYEQTVSMVDCYGSEASLLKGESNA